MPMGDDRADKRRHERVALDRTAEVHAGERRRRGRLRDISGGGAAVDLDAEQEELDQDPDDRDRDLDHGDAVEIDVDGLMPLSGQVARTFDDGLAVAFELDQDEQDDLIDAIMSGQAGLDVDG